MLKNQKSSFLKNKKAENSFKQNSLSWISGICCFGILILFNSCGNLKQLQYLQGPIDTAALSTINYVEPLIQKGDLLSITVYSDNQLASAVYNQGGSSSSNSGGGQSAVGGSGYLVGHEGNIQLYELGSVKVEGITKNQLSSLLAQQYQQRNLLKNPFVEVRFLNFKVTVIGDVNSPGVKTFAAEKVSIFDAISESGDLNMYAKRDNVLIVREVNGVRRFARLDLTDPNVFNSPYYYLQQNDMIVVDPTKLKATTTDQTFRNVSMATSLISLAAIIISFFR